MTADFFANARVTFVSGARRNRPKTGDRRTTKKHGEQVRLPTVARDHMGRFIGYLCYGGLTTSGGTRVTAPNIYP
jgi:hypothetical protein